MPLFIDRHDAREKNHGSEFQPHHIDPDTLYRHSCKPITQWFDPNQKAAFCLIEAPSVDAVRDFHMEVHGLPPRQIIKVDGSNVAQFLAMFAGPKTEDCRCFGEGAFRAILFIDMVNSTGITGNLGDSSALPLIQRYRNIVRNSLQNHDGREVERVGDGFLTSFGSAVAAVKCAVGIQQDLSLDNLERNDDVFLQARMGVGAGEPMTDDGALFGSIVNLTSRICKWAHAGQIVATRTVCELCMGKGITFRSIGSTTLKGFDEPIDLKLVEWNLSP